MITTILFDLDDTLLDFTKAEAIALRRALEEAGLPAGKDVLDRYHVINRRQWELLEEGLLTREQVLVRRFQLLFEELGVKADPKAVCEQYETYLAQGHWFVPGAPELLRVLAPRYELYLASNGASFVQRRRLESAGDHRIFPGDFPLRGGGGGQAAAGVFRSLLCIHSPLSKGNGADGGGTV